MKSETKICQNCKQNFVIEPEDFDFYKKVSVPPPTFCPDCRLQRRLAWRNERSFYRRTCSICNKEVVARYAPEMPFPVVCINCWHSDKYDPMAYGQAYDFSKPFFVQFNELSRRTPRPALFSTNVVNSDYCNNCLQTKNAYLSVGITRSEDIYYSHRIDDSRDMVDVVFGNSCEQCGYSTDIGDSQGILFSRYVSGGLNSQFIYEGKNVQNCFGCVNVRGVSNQIFNQQYSKEGYLEEIKKYDIGSYATLKEIKSAFVEFKKKFPKRYAMIQSSTNVVGDNIHNARNCKYAFDSHNGENLKYVMEIVDGGKDSYDINHGGLTLQLGYDASSCMGMSHKFSVGAFGHHIEYSESCINQAGAYLFGCVSIPSKKEYCIFNKQYTKEEYELLYPKIIQHMKEMPYQDKGGRMYMYGEHLPIEISPFAYNETAAQEFFPLTKEEVLRRGYRWRDAETKNYTITLKAENISDHIKDAPDSILKETISCEHAGICNDQCATAFRLVEAELQFCRKMGVALPRLCPNCRHYEQLRERNPLKLWHRQCMCDYKTYQNTVKHGHHPTGRCPNEFETSYAPDRLETIYCEPCYNAEVV